MTPLAFDVARAWSKASQSSFSSKVTTETPALMAPIWVTNDSAVYVWSAYKTNLSPGVKPASKRPNAKAELYLYKEKKIYQIKEVHID